MRITTGAAALMLGAAALMAGPAAADAAAQLREELRPHILGYYRAADVDALRPGQLAALHAIIHSPRSESHKRMLVRSALRRAGPGTLRDLLLG